MRNTFSCIDAHTCGNPVRVVSGGAPFLKGNSMMEKRLHFLKEYDWIRKGLMFEPRGHDMMSGTILYPPVDPAHDVGILYIETSGCLPMCGHGTIGTVTVMIEEGLIHPKTPGNLKLETPAGIVSVTYAQEGNKVKSVRLTNIPSFLHTSGLQVECPDLGMLTVDVAYGGNFYAIIDPQDNFKGIQDYTADQLICWSREIRKNLNKAYQFEHPTESDIKGLSHVLWAGDTLSEEATARNAVFYGEKAIDRSPCGTGTSARMAQWYAQGKLAKEEPFVHESYIGSKFIGTIVGTTKVGALDAIIPRIEGWAKITGYNTIFIDDDDPYAQGFQVV
ncbi:4-hydroxyproline epimerase [Croceivirga sp. JEA036]|uniref:4-hydroxyproline epimerase n=1 Tax=Croceivirga sp. JEA036 TaxID=2721162 RepID=UPI00143886A4|nr:4-hydroxyproline epimerase [Croceivirga sp. JEA036]NJB37855.1 4-hydroxyproline epimerase [Croceivirga sp. JEA036]